MKLDALEHSAEEFHELKEAISDKAFKFNKVDYRIPDLRDAINDIRDLLAEGEDDGGAEPVTRDREPPPVLQPFEPTSE